MGSRITIASVCFLLLSGVMSGYGQAIGSGKKNQPGKAADSVLQKTRNEAGKVVNS